MTINDPASERTLLPILDALTMTLACDEVLRMCRESFRQMEEIPLQSVTAQAILEAWDHNNILLENVAGPISILNHVHPQRSVRDAGDECMVRLSSFTTDLFQNSRLFERVQAVKPATPAEDQFRRDLLDAFEDTGVGLSEARRNRVKEISERLTELDQKFDRHIRDNETRLTFNPEECEGLPKSFLERVRRDGEGNIILGFDYPEYHPFMANARSDSARRRYYAAFMNRGTDDNLHILNEIVTLRRELAGLYGLPSFAHFVTRRRMVENPETVQRFLDEVKGVVDEAERRDLHELRLLKAELTGQPLSGTRIERWDLFFYRERLRERRYNVDQEALREYFPTGRVTDWILEVSARLYGIRFHRLWAPTWHKDVCYYDVVEAQSGALIGGIYMDLYPRDGKYKHAAAWPVRGASRRTGRKPVSVLVANFERTGLTHDELETFLHEFGHILHGVLSATEYNQHAGTAVQRDFVEAPSQMYEEWGRSYESLRTIAQGLNECPPIDEETVTRLEAARKFGQGIDYARQYLYATLDMQLSGENPPQVMDAWRTLEERSPMGHVAGTEFPGTFSHIAGGYAAGYYGYMWSKVIALDLLTAFDRGLMDAGTGRRFREEILSRGGERPARELVEQFLGRPVRSEAFFAEIAGTETAEVESVTID
ncbi:MAG: M3 family metallopeptidase [Acidobacteriota bacterium]